MIVILISCDNLKIMYPHTKEDQVPGQVLSATTKSLLNFKFKFK